MDARPWVACVARRFGGIEALQSAQVAQVARVLPWEDAGHWFVLAACVARFSEGAARLNVRVVLAVGAWSWEDAMHWLVLAVGVVRFGRLCEGAAWLNVRVVLAAKEWSWEGSVPFHQVVHAVSFLKGMAQRAAQDHKRIELQVVQVVRGAKLHEREVHCRVWGA